MAGPYDVTANAVRLSPNFTNLQVLPAAPSSTATGRTYFDSVQLKIGVYAGNTWNYVGGSGGGGAVSSVFGRTGAVVAASGDYSAFYYAIPTGTTSQYVRGDGSLATFPTALSLTTTGTTGAATLIGSVLNVPQYAGTVTTFSAGTLSPLFTTSVATATSTPALTFALSNAAAHTFFGNFTGSSAAPSFGSPVLASADFANQGTTTTVLHGNAAGNPSFGAVVLTTDVSGILPVANGGTGTGSPAIVAGTNVTVSGSFPAQTVNALPASTKFKTSTASGTTLTLDTTASVWVFTGSSATTWTLPALSGNTDLFYFIKNRGSATITLTRAGSDNLYTTASVTTLTINPGEGYQVSNDGSFWNIL